MTTPCLLYITCPTEAVATQLATQLVQQRMAACVSVLPAITSYYEWQGSMEQSVEVALLVKTTTAQAQAVTATIATAHPYACPCIVQLPITGGHAPFLHWIHDQTQPLEAPISDS